MLMAHILVVWVVAISLGFYKGKGKSGGSCGEEIFTPQIGSLARILTHCLMLGRGLLVL